MDTTKKIKAVTLDGNSWAIAEPDLSTTKSLLDDLEDVLTDAYTTRFNRTFGNNTISQIQYVSNLISENNLNSYLVEKLFGWKIGDEIDITLTNNNVATFRIIGFNHDTLTSDNTKKAGITLQATYVFQNDTMSGGDLVNLTPIRMNATRDNTGGWKECEFRTSQNSTIANVTTSDGVGSVTCYTLKGIRELFPTDWLNAMKMVDKNSSADGSGSTIDTTSENVFLLSEVEFAGTLWNNANNVSSEGTEYEYWANVTGASNTLRMLHPNDAPNQDQPYARQYLRSCYKNNTQRFCGECAGGKNTVKCELPYACVPAFCI